MAPKKYTNGRKPKQENGNEVLGIGLIITAAFILLCIIIPPLIGVVSRAIYGLVTGVFGFVSYPIFFGMLFWGIALVKGWKVSLPIKHIVAISVIAFCFVMILQLALTDRWLDGSFGDYIYNVYNARGTACGAFFGVVAYGMKVGLTKVFSYILLSAAIVVMVLLLFGVGKRNIFRSRKKPVEPEAPQYRFVKGEAEPHPVQPMSDTSLFVENIVPTAPQVTSGSYHALSVQPTPTASGYSVETPQKPAGNNGFDAYTPMSQSSSESDARSKARDILFGDNRSNYPIYPIEPPQKSTPSTNAPVFPTTVSSAPDVKKKPPKIAHNNESVQALPDVVFPVTKDYSDQIVGGEIINGDDLSSQIREAQLKSQPKPEREIFLSRPTLDEFSIQTIKPDEVKPIEPPQTEPELPPITNGDTFTEHYLKRQSDQLLRSETPSESLFGTSQPTEPSISYQPPEPVPTVQPPVRETSPVQESAESSLEKLLREDRAIRDRAAEVPEESADDMQDEPVELPPIINADPDTSAFKIEDEVVDLSEKADTAGTDYTGYYKPVGADTGVGNATRKSRVAHGQIGLDDYGRSAPDPEIPKPPKKKKKTRYVPPPIELLLNNSTNPEEYGGDSQEKARILEQTLESLKLPSKVVQITKGPAVTRYELEMQPGIPIKRIESFQSDIAYNLASNGKIRIETPIPGKRAVGVEVPNEQIAIVALRDIIESKQFQSASSPLTLALGKDIAGQNIVCQLEKMPHLLIAGATGSGKSACLNSIIMSILYKSTPDDVRLILIDPKEVEFAIYRNMPHLLMKDIINDTAHAVNAFKWAKAEMDRRYKLLSKYCVHNLAEFNNSQAVKEGIEEKLPRIVIIVDELCELMMSPSKKELEERIMSMAQKARAAGLHLVLATQRPSVDVITGTIKANLPSRIAFAVTSYTDSRTILDQGGAEALLGRGDMLYAPSDMPEPKRVQGAYVTTEEVTTIVNFVKENNPCDFDEELENEIMVTKEVAPEKSADDDEDDDGFDVLMKPVLKRVIISGQASTSMIQRRFSVGYARASRIIDQMETNRFIGPLEGSKPREVYITREQFREIFGEDVEDIS